MGKQSITELQKSTTLMLKSIKQIGMSCIAHRTFHVLVLHIHTYRYNLYFTILEDIQNVLSAVGIVVDKVIFQILEHARSQSSCPRPYRNCIVSQKSATKIIWYVSRFLSAENHPPSLFLIHTLKELKHSHMQYIQKKYKHPPYEKWEQYVASKQQLDIGSHTLILQSF